MVTLEVKQYRKKPVVVEAVQWDGENWQAVANFLGRTNPAHDVSDMLLYRVVRLHTLAGGTKEASVGDWIIRGMNGEFYLCNSDKFDATYEEV